MGNIDRMGLCRGTKWHKKRKRPERCLAQATNKHMPPDLHVYFLCDDCEAHVIFLLDDGQRRAVNQVVFGGRRTTGL